MQRSPLCDRAGLRSQSRAEPLAEPRVSESPTDLSESPLGALLRQRAFLRRLARSLVDEAAAADDLEQDTWVAALRRPPHSPQAAMAWIASTARRIANKVRRRTDLDRRRERAMAPHERVDGDEAAIHRLELQHAVVAAVLGLDEPYRTAITLRYLDELAPAEIADRLGVPLNTVRARLRRGLERLRTRLDARAGGDRGAWCLALTPFATAPAASAGVVSGVVAMGTKSILGSSLVAATALVSVVMWLGDPSNDSLPLTLTARPDAIPAESGSAADESFDDDARVRETQRVETEADPGAAAVVLPDPGTVEFRVVDARTGAPLAGAGLRMLSDTRFAEWRGDGAGSLVVSAGTYDVTAFARGYEHLTRRQVVVDARGSAQIGTLALEPGTASIEGSVAVAGVPTAGPITVELFGRGRHWCSECDHGTVRVPRAESAAAPPDPEAPAYDESPCMQCGYHDDRSELTVVAGQRFGFHGLAAGEYVVRVRCADLAPTPITRPITLERGRRAWLDVALEAGVDVAFALTGPDAMPFEGAWSTRAGEQQRPIYFTFDDDGKDACEGRWQPPTQAWFGKSGSTEPSIAIQPSALLELVGMQADTGLLAKRALLEVSNRSPIVDFTMHAGAFRVFSVEGSPNLRLVASQAQSAEPDRADRPRTPEDTATPAELDPIPENPALEVEHEEPGRFVVRRVPPRFLTAIVRCGPFASAPIAIDTRAGRPGPIAVAMVRLVCDSAATSASPRTSVVDDGERRIARIIDFGHESRPEWNPRTTTCTDCHERR